MYLSLFRPPSGAGLSLMLLLSLTPSTWAHPNLHQLHRREVQWVQPANPRAASSICNEPQQGWIQAWKAEAAHLAAAGSSGLGHAFNALYDSVEFSRLTVAERDRVYNTYITFFGIDTVSNAADATAITSIRDMLDRIAGIQPADYPDLLRIACDSSFYQATDPGGRTAQEVYPTWPDPPQDHSYQWDHDRQPAEWWVTVPDMGLCPPEIPAWTQSKASEPNSRVVFCSSFWQSSPQLGTLAEFGQRIQGGDPTASETSDLSMFIRMGGKIFLHEMMHTVFFSHKYSEEADKFDDVEGLDSYGPANAKRIGTEDRSRAFRNIENIVYFCLAMYYSDYNWSTLKAVPVA